MVNSIFFLSVVIPVFNEEKRLYHLDEVISFLSNQAFATELIIVNDGSTDNTLKLLKNYSQKKDLRIISYRKNKGKGYAIKQGMLHARGEYVLFMDIDLSTPLNQFEKFRKFLGKYPVIIGTRKTSSSKLIKRQSLPREMLGKCFTFLSRKLLNVQVSDFTCGFKCFAKKASREIFTSQTINRWSYDSEILYLARKYNYPIKEIVVSWKNDTQTKVKFPQDIFGSFSDLIKIRLNDLNDKY